MAAIEDTPDTMRAVRLARRAGVVRGLLATAPLLVFLLVFFVVPMFYLVRISFLSNRQMAVAAPLLSDYSLHQYIRLLTSPFFYETIWNSLQIGLFTSFATLVIGFMVAWYLVRSQGWERTLIAAACLLPIFVNLVVAVFGWSVMLLPFGAIQKTLVALGLIADMPLPFGRTITGLVIVLTYQGLPFAILILVSSIQTIRPDKIDAARLLGAGYGRIFFTVLLPLTMPGLFAAFVLVFSLSISSYLVPVLIGGGRVPVLPLQIFTATIEAQDWPLGAAMALILLGVVLVLAYGLARLAARLSRRGQWAMV